MVMDERRSLILFPRERYRGAVSMKLADAEADIDIMRVCNKISLIRLKYVPKRSSHLPLADYGVKYTRASDKPSR